MNDGGCRIEPLGPSGIRHLRLSIPRSSGQVRWRVAPRRPHAVRLKCSAGRSAGRAGAPRPPAGSAGRWDRSRPKEPRSPDRRRPGHHRALGRRAPAIAAPTGLDPEPGHLAGARPPGRLDLHGRLAAVRLAAAAGGFARVGIGRGDGGAIADRDGHPRPRRRLTRGGGVSDLDRPGRIRIPGPSGRSPGCRTRRAARGGRRTCRCGGPWPSRRGAGGTGRGPGRGAWRRRRRGTR